MGGSMGLNDKKKILDFIEKFQNFGSEVINCFMSGNCYWFAEILSRRFSNLGTRIIYFPIANHFATLIGGEGIFDISGEIIYPNKKEYCEFFIWDEYRKIDPIHADRLERDCIL